MVLLDLNNTATVAKDFTVKRGTATDLTSGGADLVVNVPASSRRLVPIRESARWAQAAQKLWIDLAAGTTGTIIAYKLPA